MPLLEPTNHGGSNTHLFHANSAKHAARLQPVTSMNALKVDHRFAIPFDSMPGINGLWVREPDGSFTYKPWSYDEAAKNGYAPEDIFVVGRGGYYLTLEEARQAIPDGVHGVSYQDMYEDEFQGVFVSDPVNDPKVQPFVETHVAEPIR